ncbi:uncharacterized protein LOC62_03G005073 [Vanrija pseudolonga]|uniref:Uncharacterized protein n=1 Tax=Vanrija pseudolonga TaxID=143232 RepID=A0AAF1BIH6_9TREE|nr:hypothetical protein LOC62_03G005073 [Vanrija pseudolonga]
MAPLFCCTSITPYRPKTLTHERLFKEFMSWASPNPDIDLDTSPALDSAPFAVQLARQVNYGPLESRRYFTPGDAGFVEVGEKALVDANFKKLNSCVNNFRCGAHNRFFEVNVYQLDPVNTHHWRSDVAWPGTEIDL